MRSFGLTEIFKDLVPVETVGSSSYYATAFSLLFLFFSMPVLIDVLPISLLRSPLALRTNVFLPLVAFLEA